MDVIPNILPDGSIEPQLNIDFPKVSLVQLFYSILPSGGYGIPWDFKATGTEPCTPSQTK